MIIDAHNHVGWLGVDPEKLIEDMDRNNIDKTWLLTWEVPENEVNWKQYALEFKPGEIGMPFSGVVEGLRKFPERIIGGYCPDPRSPDALDKLENAVDNYGIKVCGELKVRMTFDNPDALALYRLCGRKKLPVVIHLDYPFPLGIDKYPRYDYWYGGTIEAFERAVKACPDTMFIGHAPGVWAHISNDNGYKRELYPEGKVIPGGKLIKMLRENHNLFMDLSAGSARNALNRDMEFGKKFIMEFQDRLLFARDEFSNKLHLLLEDFSLPEDVLKKINYLNAENLLLKEGE